MLLKAENTAVENEEKNTKAKVGKSKVITTFGGAELAIHHRTNQWGNEIGESVD